MLFVSYYKYKGEKYESPVYVGDDLDSAWKALYDRFDFLCGHFWYVEKWVNGSVQERYELPLKEFSHTDKKPAWRTMQDFIAANYEVL